MRVLITGGAGFIGAHVGHALQARGDEVAVLDDFNAYYDPRLKRARVEALLAPSTRTFEADIGEPALVRAVMTDVRPDAVVHLAAWAGVRSSREYPELFARANVLGTVNVFEACVRAGVGRVVAASSSAVYGPGCPLPTPEEAAGDQQVSGYGTSKRAGELYAALYHGLDGLRITCLRLFTVYGPWGRPDMAVWKFTRRILRGEEVPLNVRSADGHEVTRDFTEIRDIVQGILSALDRNHAHAVINLGAADQVPLRRLIAALEKATGMSARIEERVLPSEEAVATAADLTQATTLLGFRPTTHIEEGAAAFVRWYQEDFRRRFPDELRPSQYWSDSASIARR